MVPRVIRMFIRAFRVNLKNSVIPPHPKKRKIPDSLTNWVQWPLPDQVKQRLEKEKQAKRKHMQEFTDADGKITKKFKREKIILPESRYENVPENSRGAKIIPPPTRTSSSTFWGGFKIQKPLSNTISLCCFLYFRQFSRNSIQRPTDSQ